MKIEDRHCQDGRTFLRRHRPYRTLTALIDTSGLRNAICTYGMNLHNFLLSDLQLHRYMISKPVSKRKISRLALRRYVLIL